MKTRTSTFLLTAATVLAAMIGDASAYDAMYARTDSGDIEIKRLPERTALRAAQDGSYFEKDNRLFMTLFDYIKANDVAMTTPVEAEIDQAEMRFFSSDQDAANGLADTKTVTVEILATRDVVSIGLRGAYTAELFARGKQALETWLAQNPEYEAIGSAYAVYWHGPYVPGFFKRSEVHLPIAPTAGADVHASR